MATIGGIQRDDESTRIYGYENRAFKWYDDDGTLQVEMYLQRDNTLNIVGSVTFRDSVKYLITDSGNVNDHKHNWAGTNTGGPLEVFSTGIDSAVGGGILFVSAGALGDLLGYQPGALYWDESNDRMGVGIGYGSTVAAKLHVDQQSSTAAIPAVKIDQADQSEQCIQFSSDATDRDINLWTVEVTGTPTLFWDESADQYSSNKGLALSAGNLTVASGTIAVHASPVAYAAILAQDIGLSSAASFYGTLMNYTKTGGAGDAADDYYGSYAKMELDQATTIDNLYGAYYHGLLSTGTADMVIGAAALGEMDGGTLNADLRGMYAVARVDGGEVDDVYGLYVSTDLNAGTINDEAFGIYVLVDDDIGVYTAAYMLYLDEASGITYGIYQNGTGDNYLGGKLGVGDSTPDAPIDVYNATTNIVALFESGDDIGGIKVSDDDTTGYVYAADGDIHIGGGAAKAVTELHIDVSTGYLSSGIAPGNIHLDLYDAGLTSAATFYGMRSYHVKDAGAGAATDDYYGVYSLMDLDQNTTIDNLYGGYVHGRLTNADAIGDLVYGLQVLGEMDNGTLNDNLSGFRVTARVDNGEVPDVYGIFASVDLNTGTVSDDVFGVYVTVDDDIGAAGTVTMIHLQEATGVDYAIYHATGDAPSYLNGALSLGNDANYTTRHLQSYDATLNITDDYYGAYIYHIKMGGVTDGDDDIMGIYNLMGLDHSGGTVGFIYGGYNLAYNADGTASYLISGMNYAHVLGGTVSNDVRAVQGVVDLDSGTVTTDVYGGYFYIDAEAAMTDIGGDVFGVYVFIDDDEGADGTVYGYYLDDDQTGVDYGFYQIGTSTNHLGGSLEVGANASAAMDTSFVLSGWQFAAVADAQNIMVMVGSTETHDDNTWRNLHLDGAATYPTVPADTAWTFSARIVGTTQLGGAGGQKVFGYLVYGVIVNDNGTTALKGFTTVDVYDGDDASFDAQAIASDASDALIIQVQDTDGTGDTVRWDALLAMSSVTFP